MNHLEASSEVVGNVFFTTNLDQFKFIPTNRDIEKRVKHIINSMLKDGVKYCPIIVTADGYVIDGQHRLHAARAVKAGIYFVIDYSCKTMEDAERAMIIENKVTGPWRKLHFLSHYCKKGNPSYMILRDFMNEFPEFTLTDCLYLLNNNRVFPKEIQFEEGKWKHNSVEVARKWGKFLLSLKDVFPNGYNRTTFVRSMLSILAKNPTFSTEQFLYKCTICPKQLRLQGDTISYMRMIEDIYNYKQKDEKKVRLQM